MLSAIIIYLLNSDELRVETSWEFTSCCRHLCLNNKAGCRCRVCRHKLMSLSKWYSTERQPLLAQHGEKSPRTHLLRNSVFVTELQNSYTTNLDMLKLETIDLDPCVFQCVSPYEINPVWQKRQPYQGFTDDTLVQDGPQAANLRQNWDTSSSGGFYGSRVKQVKLEMEEFSDLAPYLPSTVVKPTSNCVDELNTPVFDEEPFDFNSYVNVKPALSPPVQDDFFKPDFAINEASVITNTNDISVHPENVHSNNIIQNENISGVVIYNNNNNMINDVQDTCKTSGSMYSIVDNETLTTGNYIIDQDSNQLVFEQSVALGLVTPEDSNSSMASEVSIKKENSLLIDVARKPLSQEIVNTPDIIESVVSLEADNFNILDLIRDEEITTVNIEDLQTYLAPKAPVKKTQIPTKQPRKRRRRDDDDEDYVPPQGKLMKYNIVHETDSEGSDSDSETVVKRKAKPRGRPPRRTSSISSDCSKESNDASKYRELRDKNNEASRKSRLKRKMKELTMEKEMEGLNERNIKLKAEVEHLEKMVTNFRNNLFKIMISK